MRQTLRGALAAAAAGGVLLSGCSVSVPGSGSADDRQPKAVAADQLPITGASDDNAVDRAARNALADLNTFWSEAYPKFYGEDFRPLSGGYFSVDSKNIDPSDYPPTGIGCAEEPVQPDAVAGNAFYNPTCDAIAYDRALLEELANDFGRALPGIVLAHEFGHAIQARVGFAENRQSIQDETQADCFAGAWTAWVTGGNAEHVTIRAEDLDDVLRGYLLLRDPVGSDPAGGQAHGSYFDRVSAFSDGYDGGVASCRDDFGPDRLFTAATFDQDELANKGNSPYGTTLQIVDATLPAFWDTVFRAGFHETFQKPAIQGFAGTAPACGDQPVEDRDLGYCADDSTVYYDERDLVQPAYQELGDFAVPTAISIPYALAARSQRGLSTDDGKATRSAVCLTGWYEAQVYNGAFANQGIRISPGDIDEAVEFLLAYGVSDKVFPDVDASGFELLRAFRSGFLEGGGPCDVGL